jgi:hypothetical protein
MQVNERAHARGATACAEVHPPRVTTAIQKYILTQDQLNIPPKSILSNLTKLSGIPRPLRMWPTLQQISTALKSLRKQAGTKNAQTMHVQTH